MADRPVKYSYTTKRGDVVSVGDLIVCYGTMGVVRSIEKAYNGRWRATIEPFDNNGWRRWFDCSAFNSSEWLMAYDDWSKLYGSKERTVNV